MIYLYIVLASFIGPFGAWTIDSAIAWVFDGPDSQEVVSRG